MYTHWYKRVLQQSPSSSSFLSPSPPLLTSIMEDQLQQMQIHLQQQQSQSQKQLLWNNLKESSQQLLLPFQVNSKTHCGALVKDLKQILHESIILGRFDKRVSWAVEEIILMPSLDSSMSYGVLSKQYKSVASHLSNFFKMFCIEELSPRCIANIEEITGLLNNAATYQSRSNLLKAVQLLTFTKKSKVCTHLQWVACNKNSAVFQRFYKERQWQLQTLSDNLDALDVKILSDNFIKFRRGDVRIWYDDDNNMEEVRDIDIYRLHSIFIIGEMYRRKLGLKPLEDLGNVKLRKKHLGKTEKMTHFQKFWERLWAYSIVLEGMTETVKRNVMFRKTLFEERKYFDGEFLCLVSAVECIFAFIKQKTLAKHGFDQLSEIDKDDFEWMRNHKHECIDYKYNNNVDDNNNNVDTDWTRQDWKFMYEDAQKQYNLKPNNKRKRGQELEKDGRRKYGKMNHNHPTAATTTALKKEKEVDATVVNTATMPPTAAMKADTTTLPSNNNVTTTTTNNNNKTVAPPATAIAATTPIKPMIRVIPGSREKRYYQIVNPSKLSAHHHHKY